MLKPITGGGCLRASPVFSEDILELEGRYSDSKQRFDASLIAGAVRCRFGKVQVLVCRPFSRKLRPFPTTFWLVCPYLTHRAGELESLGGVRELEKAVSDLREWRRYNLLHQRLRLGLLNESSASALRKCRPGVFRSVMRSGIGGIRLGGTISLKCLHLQTAAYIGLGRHPGAEWLKAHGLCSECEGECSCCRTRSL